MRISEKDLNRSEKLVQELAKLELDGRKRMEEGVSRVNTSLLEFYPEFERARILQDPVLISKATNSLSDLYNRRRDLQESFHKEKESLIREIEGINFAYIDYYCKEILSEAKRILELREHRIVESEMDLNSEFGKKKYKISHNHNLIQLISKNLGEIHKQIRNMRLSPLREIKKLFDETIKTIPDDFPLTDVTECKEQGLLDFQAAQELTVFQTQQRYINLFGTPSFLPTK